MPVRPTPLARMTPQAHTYTVKAYLARLGRQYLCDGLTALDVVEAYVNVVTVEKCRGWYMHAGYAIGH